MKLAAWLTIALAFWPSSGEAVQTARNFDFGRHALGEVVTLGSTPIVHWRDCGTRSLYSCEVQLADGVWYRFDQRRVVAKSIRLPFPYLPRGIVASDNADLCRRRLERLTGINFKIWQDDDGLVFVETPNLIFPSRGQPYGISVMFRHGRMQDVVITALPHADS